MEEVTLCFCVRNDRVLLGKKKEGFGEQKWNGFGGKLRPWETPKKAAVRELFEETGLKAKERDLRPAGTVTFFIGGVCRFRCHLFRLERWRGSPTETTEMMYPQWFSLSRLPLKGMWSADIRWLTFVLCGESIDARVHYSADGKQVVRFTFRFVPRL